MEMIIIHMLQLKFSLSWIYLADAVVLLCGVDIRVRCVSGGLKILSGYLWTSVWCTAPLKCQNTLVNGKIERRKNQLQQTQTDHFC